MKILFSFALLIAILNVSIDIGDENSIFYSGREIANILKGWITSDAILEKKSHEFSQNYMQAKLLPKNQSCNHYRKMLLEEEFPLKQLIKIKILQHCDLTEEQYIALFEELKENIYPWLRETLVKEALNKAKIMKINRYIAQLSADYVSYIKNKKEKEQLLITAIKAAQMEGNNNSTKLYQEKLYRLAPRFREGYSNSYKYEVAYDLELNREFDKARTLYKIIINSNKHSIDEKIKVWNRYRLSYKKQRNINTYLHKTERMILWLRNIKNKYPGNYNINSKWIEAKINFAKATWTYDNNNKAKKILDDTLKNNITHKQMATINYILGSIYYEEKDFNTALKYYIKAYSNNLYDKVLIEDILWGQAWMYYLLKDYDKTIYHLEKIADVLNDDVFLKIKSDFWKARCLYLQGKTNRAYIIWNNLYKKHPFSYYGILANIELAKEFNPIESIEKQARIKVEPFEWLIAFGEQKIAQNYLKELKKQFRKKSQIKDFLPLYTLAQWHYGALSTLFSLNYEERNEYIEEFPQVFYPKIFQDITTRASEKFNIEPWYIYSIIRQESAYNADIRNWSSDAFGLMQLIPETAKAVSQRNNIPYKKVDDLYKPEINIFLGTAYLRELSNMFNGEFVSIAASYNAGEKALMKWDKIRFDRSDSIKSIELIPYRETRKYVKLVFRNYIIYKRYNSEGPFKIEKDMLLTNKKL